MTLLDPNAMAAAKSAGLSLSTTGFLFSGVELSNREPSPDNPLGDLKVRQALNYAVDRPAITKAVYGEFGAPTTQIGVPEPAHHLGSGTERPVPLRPGKGEGTARRGRLRRRVHPQGRRPAAECPGHPGRDRLLEKRSG